MPARAREHERPGGDRVGCGWEARADWLAPPTPSPSLEVVEAVEGPVVRDRCALDLERPHRTVGFCAVHEALVRAREAVVGALRSVTVADLARRPLPEVMAGFPLRTCEEEAG